MRYSRLADPAAQFILDMDTDDLIKRAFGAEAKGHDAVQIKLAGPAGRNPLDSDIRLSANKPYGLFAGNATQRLDLFADCCGKTRRAEITSRPERGSRRML